RAGEKLERTVAERTSSLREAIAQMEEFSHTVSHDLRAPLRAMQTYSRALLEDYGPTLGPDGLHYLQRVLDNATRLDKMILEMLTFSRIARNELKVERVCLDKLVRDLVGQLAHRESNGAEILIDPLHDALAHGPSLTQACSNLLSNALKFVRPGTSPRIRIWTEPIDDSIRLWVEDNGIGIAPEFQHRLFNMFERVPSDFNYEGTGVGLAIVRKAVERMGGKSGVVS